MPDLNSSYQFLYGMELEKRQYFEDKTTFVFSILAVVGSLIVLVSRMIFSRPVSSWHAQDYISSTLALISFTLYCFQLFHAGKFAFITKMIYFEVPLDKIYQDNKSVFSEKIERFGDDRYNHDTLEENILFGYIRDSYVKCAEHNRKINRKKRHHLIWFEMLSYINLLITIINYILFYFLKDNIAWLMFS